MKRRFKKISLTRLIFSVLSGLILALAFPHFNLGVFAYIALVPLFFILLLSDPFEGFVYGFVGGLAFFVTTAYWMFLFGRLAGYAFVIFQSLFFAAFGAGVAIIHRFYGRGARLILIPALWVSVELIRSIGPFGLSFGALGYSQHDLGPALAASSVIGLYGLSFLISLANQVAAEIILFFKERSIMAEGTKVFKPDLIKMGATLLLLPLVLTVAVILQLSGRPLVGRRIEVAVLQPNIPQEVKWQPLSEKVIFDIHIKLAKEAAARRPDIIIWPETAVPAYLLDEEEYLGQIRSLAKESGAHMLVGGLSERTDVAKHDKEAASNSAFLFGSNGELLGRYDKLRIVPFGEYIPLRPIFSWIKALETIAYDAHPGNEMTVFDTGLGRFSAVICFESTDTFLVRGFAGKGAQALIVMTNDGWFKETAAAEQHLTMAKLRAAENGFYVVQAANTGISAIIDRDGRIIEETSLGVETILTGRIELGRNETYYNRYGHILPWALLALSATSLILILRKKPHF
ncbi:MAG: apolipoprotein N-acyltransferase [Actinomycetota bacterium]|nr:apolipoprotein N-acyltransferase [Actinomycetota bacterium]